LHQIVAYFDDKTQSILQRYGPGPKVHYHTGLIDEPPPSGASVQELRRRLVDGQELMLRDAAAAWNGAKRLSGRVLDVGCGLGGGSIFWAQQFGAEVTALTCVPSHALLVARFAEQAGVGKQVRTLVCDAAAAPGEQLYDAAVAVDSSGYLPRREWLARTAALLRPGGSVFIIDCFVENPAYADLFDRHWRTRIGRIDEYRAAAREAGLREEAIHDVTTRTRHFWTATLALIAAESAGAGLDEAETARLAASRRAHTLVRDGLGDGSFSYAMLSFRREG
jgi:SAM-dependent methyltransferase